MYDTGLVALVATPDTTWIRPLFDCRGIDAAQALVSMGDDCGYQHKQIKKAASNRGFDLAQTGSKCVLI
jgi:hypothetical protein